MTAQQYQRRIQFLEYVKNNYVPETKDSHLYFYFEDYEVASIQVNTSNNKEILSDYYYERSELNSGSVILGHEFDGKLMLHLEDKYCFILYNLTDGFVDQNYLKTPLDVKAIKMELELLCLVLKGK